MSIAGKIKGGLEGLIHLFTDGAEPSEVEETIMGTGDANFDDQTRRDIEAISAGRQDFDYYINTYKSAASDMRNRQEEFSRDAIDMLVKCLPAMAGAAGVDYALPSDVPATTMGVGVYTGIRGLVLLHKYSRFTRSKGYCVRCADELKKYISDHREELLNRGDACISTIVDEAEGLVVSGNNSQQYHQLQHLDSVIKTVQYNAALIRKNQEHLEEHDGEIEHASQRLQAVEAGMLTHKYRLEEASDRLERVEKYTYCADSKAVKDERPAQYDGLLPPEEGILKALSKAYIRNDRGELII